MPMTGEKPGRKLELGSKASVTQPSMEIVHGRCVRRLKSLWWKSLQARNRQGEQLRSLERYGLAELVVSCDAKSWEHDFSTC